LTATLRERIGSRSTAIQYFIDEGSIRYFADSIMDPDPRYRPETRHPRGDCTGLVAPATFFGSATGLRGIPAGDARTMSALDLPFPSGWANLATGDEFEFYSPVTAGMTLMAHERLLDTYEKQGRSGRLIFYDIEKVFARSDGEPVLRRVLHCAAREPLPVRSLDAGPTPEPVGNGLELPHLVVGPVLVRHLAMFATATAEFVDIHYDADYARSVGLPGPIIQGLYKTALMARLLKDWTGDSLRIRSLSVQHRAMDLAGNTLTVGGSIDTGAASARHGEDIICGVWVRNQAGLVTSLGSARVAAD